MKPRFIILDALRGFALFGISLANYPEFETFSITLGVYLILCLFSALWQKYFRYGPFEWIWRMYTYGKYLKIAKS